MSALSQFTGGGGIRPRGLINGLSGFPIAQADSSGNALSSMNGYARNVLSGACVANSLKTILSLGGSGAISLFVLKSEDSTSRTHRAKITLDGVVIFDGTVVANTISRLYAAIGQLISVDPSGAQVPLVINEPLIFSNSLLIEYSSSITETNLTRFGYRYYPR